MCIGDTLRFSVNRYDLISIFVIIGKWQPENLYDYRHTSWLTRTAIGKKGPIRICIKCNNSYNTYIIHDEFETNIKKQGPYTLNVLYTTNTNQQNWVSKCMYRFEIGLAVRQESCTVIFRSEGETLNTRPSSIITKSLVFAMLYIGKLW